MLQGKLSTSHLTITHDSDPSRYILLHITVHTCVCVYCRRREVRARDPLPAGPVEGGRAGGGRATAPRLHLNIGVRSGVGTVRYQVGVYSV